MPPAIRVKVISKNPISTFQLFDLPQQHEGIRFTLEGDDYDWLVVWDDLPPSKGERLPHTIIKTHCPQSRTVLLTYEPSSVKHYGADYVKQFGMVLTSHGQKQLAHPNRHNVPPIGWWYYGGLADINKHANPPQKSRAISLFHSDKRQGHTLHAARYDFLTAMRAALPEIEIFGRGIRPVKNKSEGIDDFRYHIAVENHIGAHHWTEKLSDCFLGYALPFYAGCPNANDYFPPESFIALDMYDAESAVATIKQAIADNEYEKRLPAICEARRRVCEDYNLGNMLAKHIQASTPATLEKGEGILYSRHAMMRRSPLYFARYAWGKWRHRRA